LPGIQVNLLLSFAKNDRIALRVRIDDSGRLRDFWRARR